MTVPEAAEAGEKLEGGIDGGVAVPRPMHQSVATRRFSSTVSSSMMPRPSGT